MVKAPFLAAGSPFSNATCDPFGNAGGASPQVSRSAAITCPAVVFAMPGACAATFMPAGAADAAVDPAPCVLDQAPCSVANVATRHSAVVTTHDERMLRLLSGCDEESSIGPPRIGCKKRNFGTACRRGAAAVTDGRPDRTRNPAPGHAMGCTLIAP